MYVAGGDHQLVECLAQLYNPPVDILQLPRQS